MNLFHIAVLVEGAIIIIALGGIGSEIQTIRKMYEEEDDNAR